jgi:hypothetical protein
MDTFFDRQLALRWSARESSPAPISIDLKCIKLI